MNSEETAKHFKKKTQEFENMFGPLAKNIPGFEHIKSGMEMEEVSLVVRLPKAFVQMALLMAREDKAAPTLTDLMEEAMLNKIMEDRGYFKAILMGYILACKEGKIPA